MIKQRFRYNFFLALSLLVLTLAACSTVYKVSGEIEGQLRWQGKVYVDGDVELSAQTTVQIMPGTEIIFLPPRPGQRSQHPFFHGSELIVRGRLIAEGTAEQPIVFRSYNTGADPGAWGSVNLTESLYASFSYCQFVQADSAIHSQKSQNVTIKDSVFENNLVAIRFHSTPILIERNLIRNNAAGIRFHFDSPVIRNNLIVENQKGLFITAHPRDYHIENNHFSRNDMHVVLGEEVPEDIKMGQNYWDGILPPDASLFFDGKRSSYLGTVQINPILSEPAQSTGPSWIP